jgi:LuxR family maltose regulon positive regulatory protein
LHFLRAEIELLALQSVLEQTRGDTESAAATIEGVIDLAEREGFVRNFLDQGPLLVLVLRALRQRSRRTSFIDRLLAAFGAEARERGVGATDVARFTAPSADAKDTLTDREIEVLVKLAARLSYKEIADTLVISPFTVKGHVSSIYSKLDASGRRDAIAKARSLGYLAGS